MSLGVVLSGAAVVACYGFALGLPFFFDDLPIMTWLSRHGWLDIWTRSSENIYYRPLAFTIYKLGTLLPPGPRQIALHAISLLIHWAGAVLVMQVVKLCGRSYERAVIAGVLFAVFPFMFLAVTWITALSHPLVTMLALLAVYAALRAERDNAVGWWGLSLLATGLAPFAHESGPMCSAIVGGVVMIQCGMQPGKATARVASASPLPELEKGSGVGPPTEVSPSSASPSRFTVPNEVGQAFQPAIRVWAIALGGLLNVGAVLLRGYVPGVGGMQLAGLHDWAQNTLYFLHGLSYPIAPAIGWLVHQHGWHDLTLVKATAAILGLALIWLTRRSREWRWAARNLWWWACGALPALVSFEFGYLYISPRLLALSSAGIVMLWAEIISELGRLVRPLWGRRLVWGLLAGAIVTQNVAFLCRQQALFTALNRVYRQVLEAAKDEDNAPLGFVNLPSSLAHRDKTYALTLENVVFIPWYSNVGQFIEVNMEWRPSDAVVFSPVLQDTEPVFGLQGPGLDWEQMRQFAIAHRTVWLTRYQDGAFTLNQVGTITVDEPPFSPPSADPLARFTDGPIIESASAQEIQSGHWAITLTWLASGPVDGDIFVHVRDPSGNVTTQADGPALGGMVPVWLWQPGDRIHDVRPITLPEGTGPYTVQAGLYNADGRLPAFMDDARCPEDAVPVATIEP